MEITLSNIIGWLLLPVYWLKYPGVYIGSGCLIDIFTVRLGKKVRISNNCWIGPNVTIGDYSYLSREVRISNVSIGKFSSIGPNFKVLPYGHNYKRFSTYPFVMHVENKYKQSLGSKEKFLVMMFGLAIV